MLELGQSNYRKHSLELGGGIQNGVIAELLAMTSKFLFSLTRRRYLSSKINIVQHETEVSKLLQQVVEPITQKRLSSLGCVKVKKELAMLMLTWLSLST